MFFAVEDQHGIGKEDGLASRQLFFPVLSTTYENHMQDEA